MIAKIRKNKKGKEAKELFFSVLIVFSIFLFVLFLIINNLKTNQKRKELNFRISTLKAEVQQAEKKKKKLEDKISQAGSKESLEKIARDQLDLKKPGEEVIVVKKPEREEESNKNKKENKGWWETIKSIFSY